MRSVRLLARLALLTPWTSAWFGLWLLGALPAAATGRTAAWRARVQHGWSRGMCRILGVRIALVGPIPAGSFLLVANHLSYVDVLVLGSLMPCAFVAKADIARWPVVGFLASAMGTLFVERERKRSLEAFNQRLEQRLARGDTLVIFPEGTSTSGDAVLPFRTALLEPAAALGLPVRTAALRYATAPGERPAREVVCWWGDRTFLPHLVELLGLAGIEARVAFGAAPISAPDRKALASELQRAVTGLLEALARGREEPDDPRPKERNACAARAG